MSQSQPTVFFALSSEGMGHATRAAPVINALRERGYRVEVFCGGRVAEFLRKKTGVVHEHFFISLEYTNNVLDIPATFRRSLPKLPSMRPSPCCRWWPPRIAGISAASRPRSIRTRAYRRSWSMTVIPEARGSPSGGSVPPRSG